MAAEKCLSLSPAMSPQNGPDNPPANGDLLNTFTNDQCIQDPEGIQFYVKTGSIKNEGVEPPVGKKTFGHETIN